MKSIILATLIVSVIAALILGFSALARAKVKGRFYSFSIMLFASALYAGFYAAELLQADLHGVLFCIGFEYIGISLLTVAMFLVVRDFSGAKPAGLLQIATVSIIPSISAVLALTVKSHELLYIEPYVTHVSGLTFLSFSKGPWYWVNAIYLYGIFAYIVVTFLKVAKEKNIARRIQSWYMLAAFASPILANFIYLAGLTPMHADPTPLAFAVSGALFYTGFFKYHLFDIHPLARDTIFENMRDAAIVTGEDGIILDHNAAARALFPVLLDSDGGISIQKLFAGCIGFDAIAANNANPPVISLPDKYNAPMRLEMRRSAIKRGDKIIGEVYTVIDVTERENLQDKLQDLVKFDELTGVANRRHFYELAAVELDRARRHGRPIGFAIMDMDKFKDINDKYGHMAGDEALKLAARLCVETLRSCDVIGRIGGDEFAFIFPECDKNGAAAAAEKIQTVVRSGAFSHGKKLITLSCSIGSFGSPGPVHPDLEEILASADRRMYIDKRKARIKA